MSHRPQGSDRSTAELLRAWADNPRRAVIFDFNGTLSDDEPILARIFGEIFAERFGWEMSADHYRTQLLGHSDREIVEKVVEDQVGHDPSLTEELLVLRRTRYKEIVAEHSPITAQATALVRRLFTAQVPIAVVTGAQREDVLAVLTNCEAGLMIDLLVTEEDVQNGKPHPDGFLQGAELLERDPGDTLVFEDSVPGVLAAKRAGMTCIAVVGPDSPAMLADLADAVVPELGEHLLDGVEL